MQLGIAPGDRVAILDKNCADYLELVLALDKAGAVAVPINWRLTASELKLIIEDIRPKLVVTGPEFRANGAAAGVRTMTFEELPRGGDDPQPDVDGAVSTQFCDSGATSLPKGAMLTGWNMLNAGLCLAIEMPELREGCRSLVAMPMLHLGGAGWAIWSMQQGASLVIVREVVPVSPLNTIVEQRIEAALLVPAVMLFLVQLPQSKTADFFRAQAHHVRHGGNFSGSPAAFD
jgi:acyl-CoA synthetase (AMP-forming)/AMP-acid ligase II